MPPIPDDVFFSTVTQLNARLKKREFSCQELTRAYLDRLESHGPRLNSLALLLRESAIKKAKDVDTELKRERFRGLLQGVPFGAKDLLALSGHPTTWGARPYAAQVIDEDAAVLKRLDKQGAVLTGKLAMIELAGGPSYRFARASMTGACLNPWNKAHWAGGSSSGSGAAVAAGLVPYAIGSETSGSILTPSAYCGITGLRPTYGLVPRTGAMALSWTLDKLGPMARSVEDCAWILQAIAGNDKADPGSAGKNFYYAPQFVRPFAEIKVAFAPVDFEGWAEPAAQPDFKKAVETFRSLGVQLIEAKIPEFPYGAVLSTILNGECGSIFEELITSGKVDQLDDPKQIAGLKAAPEVSAADYLKAQRIRRLIQQAFAEFFYQYDVILAPARINTANRVSDPLDRAPQRTLPVDRGFSGLIPAGNLAGLPALSIPCGFANGLPIALQLVARPFNENLILALGKAFQDRTDFHQRRPPL